jgi:hypothetical protein
MALLVAAGRLVASAGLAGLLVVGQLTACSGDEALSQKTFVGKWQSSRSTIPIHLYENGEWEIRRDNGEVLQFGVWQYQGHRIIWTYKVGDHVGHEANSVLSASKNAFSLREKDQRTTVFQRLD